MRGNILTALLGIVFGVVVGACSYDCPDNNTYLRTGTFEVVTSTYPGFTEGTVTIDEDLEFVVLVWADERGPDSAIVGSDGRLNF